jgi:glyoxylase-like metal-dependent hydrolase (beta-lactamase superfamily II)
VIAGDSGSRTDGLYFRQLLAGRDIARQNPLARQMVNFVYAIGDLQSKQAVLVDPAYGTQELLDLLEADGMKLVGLLGTHYHPDHVGGDLMGHQVEGVAEILERVQVPVHVNSAEIPWVKAVTGLGEDALVGHESGDLIELGAVRIELIHTPGHTPGSQCFFVNGERLVSGDTLFLEGCGRTDLPGGDPEQIYESLTKRLARIPDEAVLYPGHLYSPEPSASMGETRRRNYVLQIPTLQDWMRLGGIR